VPVVVGVLVLPVVPLLTEPVDAPVEAVVLLVSVVVPIVVVAGVLCVLVFVLLFEVLVEFVVWALALMVRSATSNALVVSTFFISVLDLLIEKLLVILNVRQVIPRPQDLPIVCGYPKRIKDNSWWLILR
jgi:hypothetical protein